MYAASDSRLTSPTHAFGILLATTHASYRWTGTGGAACAAQAYARPRTVSCRELCMSPTRLTALLVRPRVSQLPWLRQRPRSLAKPFLPAHSDVMGSGDTGRSTQMQSERNREITYPDTRSYGWRESPADGDWSHPNQGGRNREPLYTSVSHRRRRRPSGSHHLHRFACSVDQSRRGADRRPGIGAFHQNER